MDKVDFKQYVKKLTDNLLSIYSAQSRNLKTEISSENVKLNIETAIPCGLIINELLTNSLKYAFPHGREGTIYLKIKKTIDDKYVLLLGDNEWDCLPILTWNPQIPWDCAWYIV